MIGSQKYKQYRAAFYVASVSKCAIYVRYCNCNRIFKVNICNIKIKKKINPRWKINMHADILISLMLSLLSLLVIAYSERKKIEWLNIILFLGSSHNSNTMVIKIRPIAQQLLPQHKFISRKVVPSRRAMKV